MRRTKLVENTVGWWKGVRAILASIRQISWMAFREVFLENFYSLHFRVEWSNELNSFRQTIGMSVVKYSHRFHALGMFAPGVISYRVEKCDRFGKGLLMEIQKKYISSRYIYI
ncbi:hypothetical protein ACH5RR_023227 [Cinchona calisaya]|uniref:Retrotransposon gag domain-containing protein n=1 Tax=Cinchona calisaya TaxID=153742 RepID=A0ABD2ZDC9_9GENT